MAYSDIYEEEQKAFEESKPISDYPSHYNKTQQNIELLQRIQQC